MSYHIPEERVENDSDHGDIKLGIVKVDVPQDSVQHCQIHLEKIIMSGKENLPSSSKSGSFNSVSFIRFLFTAPNVVLYYFTDTFLIFFTILNIIKTSEAWICIIHLELNSFRAVSELDGGTVCV